MKNIKGFASHSLFVDNAKYVVRPFGELSPHSETYERDIGIFPSKTDKQIVLHLFKSLDDTKPSGQQEVVPTTAQIDLSSLICTDIYTYIISAARIITPAELQTYLLGKFRDKASHFVSGPMATDGVYTCPQWVSFKDLTGNDYRWWFSDEVFRREYDLFEILIIPPVDNMEIFFSTPARINEELAAVPVSALTRKANAARDNHPVTVFRLDTYNWYNPKTNKPEIPTNWYVLIWGDAGDNVDDVRQAIEDTIMNHPTNNHTRDEWVIRFPEIFKRSEFVIVPQWDVYSQEAKVKEEAALYSPFADHKRILPDYLYKFAPEFNKTHVTNYSQVLPTYFRSVTCFTIGRDENRDNKFKLQDLYPDYINVPSTSTDFNYQSRDTQKFSEKLNDMLAVAEVMTEFSELPRGTEIINGQPVPGEKIYTRTKRNGFIYLVMRLNGYNYLVLSKKSLLAARRP